MTSYRYLLCDLLTDQILAALPLQGVSFGKRISRVDSLTATMDASNRRNVELAKLMRAYAGRAALYAYRDNQLWWGGILWTTVPKQGERGPVQASVSASTFDSYAHHRVLYADKTYTQIDHGVIIPDLWRTIQADASGDIGVEALDQPAGVLHDRTYLAHEHQYVGKLIEDLGDVDNGPEHTIDVFLDGAGNRVKRLRVADRLGVTSPRVVFQRAARGGGRVVEWELPADAVDGGTAFQTRGDAADGNAGEDVAPLLSARVERSDLLNAGWPRLDVVEDFSGVSRLTTLNAYANALAARNGGALPTSKYTVEVGSSGWHPGMVGDTVRIKLTDDWHDGVDLTVRPVGCRVTAAERGAPERVQLLFGEDG